jgi:hypothetical protein
VVGKRHRLDLLVERCRIVHRIGIGFQVVDLAAGPELGDALAFSGLGDVHFDAPRLVAGLAGDLQLACMVLRRRVRRSAPPARRV